MMVIIICLLVLVDGYEKEEEGKKNVFLSIWNKVYFLNYDFYVFYAIKGNL